MSGTGKGGCTEIEVVQLTGERYSALRPDGSTLWETEVDFGNESPSSFCEHVVWSDAAAVAVGAKSTVVLLDLLSGKERFRIDVPSYFGHLSVQRVGQEEWLFVLGWFDVQAYGPDFSEKWVSRNVAVDGITGGIVSGDVLLVSAEMDPPGGWFSVQLDVRTGRERTRKPDFTDNYFGMYGR